MITDLSVSVDNETKSPPSTDLRVELTQHHRGPGHWQVTTVSQSLQLGAGIPLLEQVTNIGAVGRPRFDFYAPFYNLAGCDGAPARFFAVTDG